MAFKDAMSQWNSKSFIPIILIGSNDKLKNFYLNFYSVISNYPIQIITSLNDIVEKYQSVSLFDDLVSEAIFSLNKISSNFLDQFKEFYQRFSFKYPVIISLTSAQSEFAKFVITNKDCCVIECYNLKPTALAPYLKRLLSYYALDLDRTAFQYLTEIFSLYPDQIFQELRKLSLYQLNQSHLVTIDIIKQVCQFNNLTQLDMAVHSLLKRDLNKLNCALPLALLEADQFLIIRVFIKLFQQLLDLHARLTTGANLDQSLAQVVPFVFFTQKKILKQCYTDWPVDKCLNKLEALNVLERDIKMLGLSHHQVKQYLLMLGIEENS